VVYKSCRWHVTVFTTARADLNDGSKETCNEGSDLGVVENLAKALGVLSPREIESGLVGNPEASLKNMLANAQQREALVAFVDEAMGGADRTTDPRGVVWLPIVELKRP